MATASVEQEPILSKPTLPAGEAEAEAAEVVVATIIKRGNPTIETTTITTTTITTTTTYRLPETMETIETLAVIHVGEIILKRRRSSSSEVVELITTITTTAKRSSNEAVVIIPTSAKRMEETMPTAILIIEVARKIITGSQLLGNQ